MHEMLLSDCKIPTESTKFQQLLCVMETAISVMSDAGSGYRLLCMAIPVRGSLRAAIRRL